MRISKGWKRTAALLAFVLGVVFIDQGLEFLLIPYTYARVDIHRLETRQYDDLFVGTSHGKCGINPLKVDEVTGRKSTNLCLGGQYTVDSYFIVKEACRVNPPKRVIYELDPSYWMTEISQDSSFGQTFRELPFSLVKAEYYFSKFMDKDFRNSLFPWYLFREAGLVQIRKNVRNKLSEAYREYSLAPFGDTGETFEEEGFVKRIRRKEDIKTEENLSLWNQEKINQKSVLYFEKMAELCEKNGIELVVITTPVAEEMLEKYGEYQAADEFFTDYFQKRGIPYINFNTKENHPGLRLKHYVDCDGHMYGKPANKFSRLLGEVLKAL